MGINWEVFRAGRFCMYSAFSLCKLITRCFNATVAHSYLLALIFDHLYYAETRWKLLLQIRNYRQQTRKVHCSYGAYALKWHVEKFKRVRYGCIYI